MLSPTFERGQGTRKSVRDLWFVKSAPSFGSAGSSEHYFIHRVTGQQQWEPPPGFYLDEVERQISTESIDELISECSSPADILSRIGLVPLSSAFLTLSEAFELGEDTAKSVDVTSLHLALVRLRRARIRSLQGKFGQDDWRDATCAFGFALPRIIASFLTQYLPAATAMEAVILLSEMAIADSKIANGLLNGDIVVSEILFEQCILGFKRALFGRKEALEYRAAIEDTSIFSLSENDSNFIDIYMLFSWLQFTSILIESSLQRQDIKLSISTLKTLSYMLIEVLKRSTTNPNSNLSSLQLLSLITISLIKDPLQRHVLLTDAIAVENLGSILVRALDSLLDSTISDSTSLTVFHIQPFLVDTVTEDAIDENSLNVLSLDRTLLLHSLLCFASALIGYKALDESISGTIRIGSSSTRCLLYSSDAKVLLEISLRECSNLPEGEWLIRSAWFNLVSLLIQSSVWYEGGLNKNIFLCEKIRNLSLEFSKSTKEIELQNSAQSVNRALKESEDNMLEI
jgi:hypothetical protein